jgi:hypothetical protein
VKKKGRQDGEGFVNAHILISSSSSAGSSSDLLVSAIALHKKTDRMSWLVLEQTHDVRFDGIMTHMFALLVQISWVQLGQEMAMILSMRPLRSK